MCEALKFYSVEKDIEIIILKKKETKTLLFKSLWSKMFLKDGSFTQQSNIYLIKNTVKTVIL